jgi:uncharacterized protein
MKNTANAPLKSAGAEPAADALLASRKHTGIFLAICVMVTVISALNANSGSGSNSTASPNHLINVYLFLIGLEWLWVRFVYKGMQQHGRSIVEFFGQRWFTPSHVAKDIAYAALAYGLNYAYSIGRSHLFHHGVAPINPLVPVSPQGVLGISVWLALSLTAGICEEIVFRGYLQRQLKAITGSTSIAIFGQAVIFGIGHGYEGVGAVIAIVVHGLVLGALAAWCGNIRACIVEHAAWDILEGLGITNA